MFGRTVEFDRTVKSLTGPMCWFDGTVVPQDRCVWQDNSLEAHQERMNFQRARISEVNMQLRTLVDSSEKVSSL